MQGELLFARPLRALLLGANAALLGALLASTGSESYQHRLHRAVGTGYTYRGVDANPLWLLGVVLALGGLSLFVAGIAGLIRQRATRPERRPRAEALDGVLGVTLVALVLLAAANAPSSSAEPRLVQVAASSPPRGTTAAPAAPDLAPSTPRGTSPEGSVAPTAAGSTLNPWGPDTRAPEAPSPRPATGQVDSRALRAWLHDNGASLHACHARVAALAGSDGRATLRLDVDAQGAVTPSVQVYFEGADPRSSAALARCLEERLRTARLPPPEGPARVVVPYTLRASDAR